MKTLTQIFTLLKELSSPFYKDRDRMSSKKLRLTSGFGCALDELLLRLRLETNYITGKLNSFIKVTYFLFKYSNTRFLFVKDMMKKKKNKGLPKEGKSLLKKNRRITAQALRLIESNDIHYFKGTSSD